MTRASEQPPPAPQPPEAARARTVGRVPDFFIVGHEKCGTTALYNVLRQHPQLFMPELKEPRYFVGDRPAAAPDGESVYPRTLERYLALFAPAGADQLAGEASPQYIRAPDAARRIAELQPQARIIVILREPVSFLRTYHLNALRDHVETERDLLEALALEPRRREGKRVPRGSPAPSRLLYSEHVRYVEQLRRFQAVLGRAQIHVIVYEDFRRDNAAAVRGVLRFLGVDQSFVYQPSEQRRERKAVRLRRMHRVALALQRARRTPERSGRVWLTLEALLAPALRAQRVENLLRRLVFSVAPAPEERVTLELRRRFKPEVIALSEYLGRDLVSEWGYSELG